MATNFNWNHIPGVQNTTGSVAADTAPTDHFDAFFNSQLGQTPTPPPQTASPLPTDSSSPHYTQPQSQSQSQSQAQQPQQLQQQELNHFPSSSVSNAQSQLASTGYLQHNNAVHSDSSLSNVFNKLNLSAAKSHSDDTIDTIKSGMSKAAGDSNSPLKKVMENPTHSSSTDTIIADNDSSIPLSLALNDMSQKELKTYLRWYENIQERKTTNKTVTLEDVFLFMQNFRIPQQIKERMKMVFTKWSNSLNIGQFFALMRLLAHALLGEPLARSLIKVSAPVPRPISILSRKRKERSTTSSNDTPVLSTPDEPKKKLDIDSFTEFILTGERPSFKHTQSSSKSHKKVKFSEIVSFSPPPQSGEEGPQPQPEIPMMMHLPQQHVLDFSLPMDQLLDRLKAESTGTPEANQSPIQPQLQQQPLKPQPTENEEEVLKDVQMDTFKNITQKATQNTGEEPLKPNLTGSASKSMKEHFLQQFDQTFNFNAGSFDSTYPSISALSAVPATSSPSTDQLPIISPSKETPPATQNSYNTSQMQMQPQLQRQLTQPQDASQAKVQSPDRKQTDYFGMVPQNETSGSSPMISNLAAGMGVNSTFQPPVPPRSRSRAGSSASPPPIPPPPPPPRARKSSRATSVNTQSNPALPPKPVLNEQQKQQYLLASEGDNMIQLNPLNGMANMNANGLAAVNTGYGNSYNLNGMNNISQVNQLNQITQMHQMGSINNMNGLNSMNGLASPNMSEINVSNVQSYNRPPQMVYGQQGTMGQSPQFQNQGMFMSQQTGGGWPSLHQQQPQQQQQPPSQLQPQQTSSHPQQQQNAWAGWQY
ncbi:hypothetical protein PMKS-003247 [Pichia membranifaciens]|uniref:EH domain-containing protein n=1 Tax=Pichia membranifaciens TaxID=4926 RepID=A0A1Q2YJP4_9ASCO|nr:hypothetical protein PMKS-003247 [Pichia membranifaciens]